jgi:hypothetical protein
MRYSVTVTMVVAMLAVVYLAGMPVALSVNENKFVDGLIKPAFGDSYRCVTVLPVPVAALPMPVEPTPMAAVEVKYKPSPGCDAMLDREPLNRLTAPGRHVFIEVGEGSLRVGGVLQPIGPYPKGSPAYTWPFAWPDSYIFVVDPERGFGYLPYETMEDSQDSPTTAGEVVSHELGHATCKNSQGGACDPHNSNRYAVQAENRYRRQMNPTAPIRVCHTIGDAECDCRRATPTVPPGSFPKGTTGRVD